MGSCFAFSDDVSAVNKSWICQPHLFGNSVTTDENDGCMFLYEQQYNRPRWFCGYIEAAIIICVSFVAFPTNFIAVYNFKRRGATHEFLLLITALAICNLMYASLGVIKGIGRVTIDWPLGQAGCAFSTSGSSIAMAMSWWTFALISNERRHCITSSSLSLAHHRPPTGTRKMTRRFWQLATALACLFVGWLVFHYFHLHFWNALRVIRVHIGGVKKGKPVTVCIVDRTRLGIRSDIFLPIFLVMTYCIPLVVIIVNYGLLWRYVRLGHGSASQNLHPEEGEVKRAILRHQRKREMLLSRLMVASVAQFFVSVLPLVMVLVQVAVDRNSAQKKALSFGTFFSLTVQVIDAALNPFWSSLVRYHQPSSEQGSFIAASSLSAIQNEQSPQRTLVAEQQASSSSVKVPAKSSSHNEEQSLKPNKSTDTAQSN